MPGVPEVGTGGGGSGGGGERVGKKPSYSTEWSRKQVLCRSGLKGPGESFAIPFAGKREHAKAEAEAQKWVAAKAAALGW